MQVLIKFQILLIVWCAVLLVVIVNAADILFIFPFFSRSQFGFHIAMARSLQAAGHKITVVHSFPRDAAHQNFTFIDSSWHKNKPDESNRVSVSDVWRENSIKMLIRVIEETEIDCHQTIQTKEIQKILQSKEKLFDVIFVNMVQPLYECFIPIAEIMQIPVIGTVGTRSWRKNDWKMGNPYNPATVPMELTSTPRNMNFIHRMQNMCYCIVDSLFYSFYVYPREEVIIKKHFSNLSSAPRIKPSLLFVNDHPIFVPRPLVPNVIHIGGISLPSTKPLPRNLQKFMDEAEKGVILFTFGSLMKMFPKSSKEVDIFKTVFAQIPQRVIWKSEEEIEDLPGNVLVSKWLPQRDILAHKNLVAFITHCGISGIYEAVLEGKPLIMIPAFFDQMSNAAILADLGVGLVLDVRKITQNEVFDALNNIVNDKKYREQTRAISKIIKTAPMTPQQSVVYWTEYIVRNKGADYLRTSEADMPLYQNLLSDVILFTVFVFLLISLLVYWVSKKIYFHLLLRKM